ncbi:MAG: acetyl-CoA acetyltransferase [Actinomycetota bacterium]|nr:acetyl-CoA acetyltransferase [Actinomycetota bacterium]
MELDPRTPVVVGVGQLVQRADDPADAVEPLAMMTDVVVRAAEDAGAPGLAKSADAVWVVQGAWPYHDPGALIGERLGASLRHTALSPNGGNSPQSLLNKAATSIAAGERDVVVLCGAEAIHSRRAARAAGVTIPTTHDDDTPKAPLLGAEVPMSSDLERSRGFEMPINIYPLFESAIRHARGETIEGHLERVSQLWAGFNRVAVANPYAWSRTPMTAAEIATPSRSNRMVGFPYTKAMNSNWYLDQAAAVIVCSAGAAAAAGVPRERWVFPWAGTDAHDTPLFSERLDLHSSPAIRTAGAKAFELAGIGVDDVAHVDLYSCFPSAVQIAAAELGLGLDRQLTQTGGLTFAGGPLNNYVMHGIASLVATLREHPGEVGLQTANGGYVTKHAIGLYSTEPPTRPFAHEDCQDAVDALGSRETAPDHDGEATLEAYTVMHDHDGPRTALVTALTADGRRALASSGDAGFMASLMATESVGTTIHVSADGTANPT